MIHLYFLSTINGWWLICFVEICVDNRYSKSLLYVVDAFLKSVMYNEITYIGMYFPIGINVLSGGSVPGKI